MYVHAQNSCGMLRPRPRKPGWDAGNRGREGGGGMFCANVPPRVWWRSISHVPSDHIPDAIETWGQAHPAHPAGTLQSAWHTWCPSDRRQPASRPLARIKRGGAASGAVRDSVLPVPNRRGSPTTPVPKRWHRRGNSSSNHSAQGFGGDRAGEVTGRERGRSGSRPCLFGGTILVPCPSARPWSHLRQRINVCGAWRDPARAYTKCRCRCRQQLSARKATYPGDPARRSAGWRRRRSTTCIRRASSPATPPRFRVSSSKSKSRHLVLTPSSLPPRVHVSQDERHKRHKRHKRHNKGVQGQHWRLHKPKA